MALGDPSDIVAVQRALAAFAEDEDLQDVCESNGLTKEEFVGGRYRVTYLECFLSPIISLDVFRWFPMLQELQLINCSLERVYGLDRCPNLERLWLNENNLRVIEGLGACTRLRELYLYSNEISRMEGLETLADLEVLWLMENQIRVVEGLEYCRKLKVLSLASNLIETVHGRLDGQLQLEELNIAGNHIGSFHDIPYLDKLPNLRAISFSDPHYGINPVCHLCNYQTYTIHHLRRITKLDCLLVTDDQRHLAEATFAKKKMYYNMRIKTLKRNTTNLLKKGLLFKQSKRAEIGASVPALARAAKVLQHHLYELEHGLAGPEAPALGEVVAQLQEVTARLEQRQADLTEVEDLHNDMRRVVQSLSIHQISRFMVELQTGGNIRLEEGKAADPWFKSCVDLVRSRFYAEDFHALGLRDIRITKVTRIHNRFLRNRFEDQLGAFMDPSDALAKRALEYLFYGEDPEVPGEVLRALQLGFQHPAEYEALGKDGGVPLTNSVFLCEEARLRARLAAQPTGRPTRRFDGLGHFLIAKVYMGNAVPDTEAEGKRLTTGTLLASKQDEWRLRLGEYGPGADAAFRCKPGDLRQRTWLHFNHAMVLPEYLVECVYEPLSATPGPGLGQDVDELNAVIARLTGARSEVDLLDMKVFAYPFVAFMQSCNVIASGGPDVGAAAVLPTAAREPPRVADLTPEALRVATRGRDVTQVSYLNLLGSSLPSAAGAAQLRSVRVLVLAFAGLQRLEGLAGLPLLERLDLSFNALRRVESLHGLPLLAALDLSYNQLHRLDDLEELRRSAPRLQALQLTGNALCDAKGYRGMALQHLVGLSSLDGRPVTPADREAAASAATTITPELLLANAAFQFGNRQGALAPIAFGGGGGDGGGTGSPADGAFLNIADALEDAANDDANNRPPLVPPVPLAPPSLQLGSIVTLNLSRMRLQRMQGLEGLRHLRRLTLADNEIGRIEGLETCNKLEELNLEDNRIQRIEGLQGLPHLRRLELGKNKIAAVEGFQGNPYLSQLSMEDNDVASLAGLERLPCLMELYLNNNKLETVREAHHLRDLEKLIILDLSGNPMCKDPEYRLYAVYQLKKLKVFDGTSVDASETALAKETFTGKMTPELLAERAGSSLDWAGVTELTLSHCGLKELALLGQFRSLAVLKADHNLLADLKGLETCTLLRRLDVSFNRFKEALDTREPPQRNPVGRYLMGMPYLDTLTLDANGIQSIGSLQLQLPGLRSLSLRQNDVSRLGGLDFLPQLQTLSLDKNRLRALEPGPLAAVPRLTKLQAEENLIRTLEGLGTLPALRKLSLGANRIAEPSEIEHLDNLDALEEVWLMGNALARKPHYRTGLIARFPRLTLIDGKEVAPEERERALAQQDRLPDPLYPAVLAPTVVATPAPPQAHLKVSNLTMPANGSAAHGANEKTPVPRVPRGVGLRGPPAGVAPPSAAALLAGHAHRPAAPARTGGAPTPPVRARASPRAPGTNGKL